MKKRALQTALSLLLILSLLPITALAAVFGDELRQSGSTIAAGTALYSGVSYGSNGYIRDNYIVYTPNETVSPAVVYGSKLCNYGNFKSMAKLLEDKGLHVVGGINGDYYDMSTNAPLGIVITDGELISSDGGHYAVCFDESGNPFISKPALSMSFVSAGNTYPLASLNKVRVGSGFALFTSDFSYNTKNTEPGTDIILTIPDDTKLRVNCTFTATVEQIVKSSVAMELPEDRLVLSVSDESDPWRLGMLEGLAPGSTIDFTISCADERLDSAVCAVGSLYKLVTSGAVEPELDRTANPRTAVGILADGSAVFYTVDGRQSGFSAGASMETVANRLIELGCVEATLLDGGGSTNMTALYVGDSSLSQINSPSDGSPRSVTNYIMLVTRAEASDGEAALLGVTPSSALLLAGAETDFTLSAADNAAFPVALPADASVSSDAGNIDFSGHFVAGSTSVSGFVALSSPGLETVRANVTVIETPDSISVQKGGSNIAELTVSPGAVAKLSALAMYNRLPVTAQDECFTWACSGVGTIDEHGVFTANAYNCSGSITVSAGTFSVSIPVTVKGIPYLLADFEGGAPGFSGSVSVNEDKIFVSRGDKSLKMDYSLEGGRALLCTSELKPGYSSVHLQLYGDGSGNTLYIGESEAVTLDFTGWQLLNIPCTPGSALNFSISGSGSGSIYLDQIVCSPTSEPDITAPALTLAASGFYISGTVSEEANVTCTIDGKPLEFSLRSGKITAHVTDDGYPHRVTLTAADLYGNLARVSVDIPPAELAHPFEDMLEHWGESYTSYLFSLGYLSGYETETGRVFEPDEAMTRADFAVLVSKWLGVDTSLYEGYELNFSDLGEVDERYLPYIRAVCALDIIRGSNDYGVLRFAPNDPLTRAQAMTMIGRVLPRGYAESDLPFSDAESVPDWSLPYVRSLVAQKVVSGHNDGTLMPNDHVTRAEAVKIIAAVF